MTNLMILKHTHVSKFSAENNNVAKKKITEGIL
jgi:hypothetical protein